MEGRAIGRGGNGGDGEEGGKDWGLALVAGSGGRNQYRHTGILGSRVLQGL